MLDSLFGFAVDPNNLPLSMPGIYRVTHIPSGRVYIGVSRDVRGRARQHAQLRAKDKFANALKKYGIEQFLFEPIFYWTDGEHDRVAICELEAALIRDHDAIRSGFNVKAADGGVGPYGQEFSDLIRAAHARKTPEERSDIMRRVKAATPPEKRSEIARRNALSIDAETRSSRVREARANQTAEKRAEIGRAGGLASAVAITPERRRARDECIAAAGRNRTHEERLEAFSRGLGLQTAEQLSENGRRGVQVANGQRTAEERQAIARKANAARFSKMTPEERVALAKHASASRTLEEQRVSIKVAIKAAADKNRGSRYITDGARNRRVSPNEELPQGWRYGMTR